MLLADKGKANPQQQTLDLLNAGWTTTTLTVGPAGMMTTPQAIAVFFEVELARCNRPLNLQIELVDEDGQVIQLPGPAGPQPMRVTQSVTVRPPAAPTGTPGTGNALIEMFPGVPLSPGRYSWRVNLDGEHREDWEAGFYVNAPPSIPAFGSGVSGPSVGGPGA